MTESGIDHQSKTYHGPFPLAAGEPINAPTAFHLAAILENLMDGFFSVDPQWRYTYVNYRVEELLGKTRDDLIGRVVWEIFPPSPGTSFYDKAHEAMQTRTSLEYEDYSPVLYKWFAIRFSPFAGGLAIFFQDITERKQAEERQRLLDEASEALMSSLDHQITLKEIAGLIVPALADYCRIALLDEHGQIKEIRVNHIDPHKIALVHDLYEHYRDRASITYGLQKLLQTGKPELMSTVSSSVLQGVQDSPDLLNSIKALGLQSYMGIPLIIGERIIGAITFSSIQPHRHYTHEDLVFAQELAHRIALVLENARLNREAQEELVERKRTEVQLRQSEERYRLVVENTTDLITLLDMHGTILYISPSCQTLLGYQPDDMVGKAGVSFNHPDDLPHIEAEFARVLQGGVASVSSYRAKHKDGHWVVLAGTESAIYDDQGRPALIVSTSHDITKQRELEQRKDEFIWMASHELRTPVTSLKGFTHVLQRHFTKQKDEQALLYLARMDMQLNKLTKLINDLLDISKMQTGKLVFQEELFDMDVLVRETVETLQAVMQTHRLMIEQTESALVYGDKDRIGQVLINLLTNAVRYSYQSDTVIIRVSKDQKHVMVSVQDFGIGIAEAHQQKIFERFYQVSEPEARPFAGLGIGLHISSEIIKRHAGNLWVESTKGKGSTFHFILPLQSGNKTLEPPS